MKNILVVEDDSHFNWYWQVKARRWNHREDIHILSAQSPEEAYQKLEQEKMRPDLVITDLKMGTNSNAGWELARRIRKDFPDAFIFVQSTGAYPIMAEVDGAIYKTEVLYGELIWDMMEEGFINRRSSSESGRLKPIQGSSLGSQKLSSRESVVGEVMKNIEDGNERTHLILPSSLLEKIDGASLGQALRNSNTHVDIVWDGKLLPGPTERMEYLNKLGMYFLKDKNFHANLSDKKLDSFENLQDKVSYYSAALEARGISPKQVVFLKPENLSKGVPNVLSLRAGSPQPIILMLYLRQIEGNPAYDLLDIFKIDPKTGDFIVLLDKELEALFLAQLGARLAAQAA